MFFVQVYDWAEESYSEEKLVFPANRRRKTLLPLCHELLLMASPRSLTSIEPKACSRAVWQCPRCGGSMFLMQRFTALELQSQSLERRIHFDSS